MKRSWIAIVLAMLMLLSGLALAEGSTLDSDMGMMQLIRPNDPTPTPAPQDLSHLVLGETYTLPGYAKVKPVSFGYVDSMAQYHEGKDLSLKQWISYSNGNADIKLDGHNDQIRSHMHDYVLLIESVAELEPANRTDLGLSAYLDTETAYAEWMKMTTFIPDCHWLESGPSADFACIDFQIVNMQGEDITLSKRARVIVNYDGAQYSGWIRQVNVNIGQVYRYCLNEAAPHYPYAAIVDDDEIPLTTGQVGTYVVGATLPNIAIEEENTPLSITLVLNGEELTYHIR